MTPPDDVRKLEKDVKRTKRIATEWASQLHDLVEDRLPAGYEDLPQIAQRTYEACEAWRKAVEALEAGGGASALTLESNSDQCGASHVE